MSGQSRQAGAFSRAEWAIVAALVLTLGLLALAGGRTLARVSGTERFEAASAAALRAVGERVVEMRGVMKSMLGMHYASDEFAGADIEAFAEQLRAYSPFVRSIGMFGTVDGALREDYERYHAMRNEVPFGIHGWDEAGRSKPPEARERYVPIESIDPLDERGLRFLGTDLGGVDSIAGPLGLAIRNGEGFVAPLPGVWPIGGDALLLQPVYLSAQPPPDEAERLETHLGGIWVAIDLSRMLGTAIEDLPAASVVLSLETPGAPPAELFARDVESALDGIDFGFGDAHAMRTWRVGDSRVSMRLRMPLRASADELGVTLLGALLAALLGSAAAGVVYQQRLVRRERALSIAAVEAEREKAERTLASISDAVITIDANGHCLYVNRSACLWFGLDPARVVEAPLEGALRFSGAESGAPLELDALAASIDEERGELEIDVLVSGSRRTGSTFALTLSRMASSAVAGTGFILVLQNVSKEREMTMELERRAHRDSLTGCYNRFYFEQRLRELVDDLPNGERRHALCYIDLDQFKIVNDTCGHAAGDRLLRELTEALSARLRTGDVFARLGGDEFGVIIVDVSPDEAKAVADKLFDHFQNAVFEHEGHAFPVRGSLGLVEIGERNRDLAPIMKAADVACYAAKDGGRNALVVYSEDDESMARHQEEMNWLPVLEQALAEDRFELLVQPIASFGRDGEGGGVRHHEFLLRLIDEAGERVVPHRFIRAAERYDMMRAIDRWVIERAMRMVAGAGAALDADTVFSINLSGQSAADAELLPFITETLAGHGLDARRFWFEITETAAITHFANAVALSEGLHALGAKVALDDFGAGLSSFACLRDLPIDILKIDGQFVRDVATSPVAHEMVRAMSHVARAMELETVAEFVEDADILQALEALDIDHAQGYHVGRPCAFAEMLESAGRVALDQVA